MAAFNGDVSAYLSKTVTQFGFSTSTSVRRVPFTFTSEKRLDVVGQSIDTGNQTSVDLEAKRLLLARLGTDVATINAILNTTDTLPGAANISPLIRMAVNPQAIKWTQNKRTVRKDTRDGATFFHFTNINGQNNDILNLDFQGTTGNIDTRGIGGSIPPGNQNKLVVWHQLYHLTREPMLFVDRNGIQRENKFYLIYKTKLFPVPVTFVGFFNKVLDFEESADRPFTNTYSMGFTVTDTAPSLDDMLAAISIGASVLPTKAPISLPVVNPNDKVLGTT